MYAAQTEEAAAAENVVAGIILLYGIRVRALFDTGASHSFIDRLFAELHGIPLVSLLHPGRVVVPDHSLDIREICPSCPVRVGDWIMPADLFALRKLGEFDVVLGMDWLTKYFATIDCKNRTVTFREPGQAEVVYRGCQSSLFAMTISSSRARQLISRGCVAYLATVVLRGETDAPRIEDIPVVREFGDVFPAELPGMPPDREIEFVVDLVPETTPISKAPYRMAPVELKELKAQLQDFWIRVLCDRVCHLGEHRSYLLRRRTGHFAWTARAAVQNLRWSRIALGDRSLAGRDRSHQAGLRGSSVQTVPGKEDGSRTLAQREMAEIWPSPENIALRNRSLWEGPVLGPVSQAGTGSRTRNPLCRDGRLSGTGLPSWDRSLTAKMPMTPIPGDRPRRSPPPPRAAAAALAARAEGASTPFPRAVAAALDRLRRLPPTSGCPSTLPRGVPSAAAALQQPCGLPRGARAKLTLLLSPAPPPPGPPLLPPSDLRRPLAAALRCPGPRRGRVAPRARARLVRARVAPPPPPPRLAAGRREPRPPHVGRTRLPLVRLPLNHRRPCPSSSHYSGPVDLLRT
uniref:Uncharacterized protein n=1 Tax=Ananas comosus var. bracteatus TaxID=296719 RepID=A0A6V7NY60_ANACO|nr:unnamed protein product [Ananas comosus var. bracteatus]